MAITTLNRRHLILTALATGLAAPSILRAAQPSLRIGAILPMAGRGLPQAGLNLSGPAESARKGLVIAVDAIERATPQGTQPHRLLLANAPEAASTRRAAERLVERDRVGVLIGGFSTDQAQAIGAIAREAGVLFINIAAPSAALRTALCGSSVLHLEASAGTYAAALADLYRQQDRTHWHLIHQDDPENEEVLAQVQDALRAAGASVVATSGIGGDSTRFRAALSDVRDSNADATLMLADWLVQQNLLATADSLGIDVPITGFPWAGTQTRDFYNRTRQLAPSVGGAPRVALWEARLDGPDAAAANADFLAKWRVPMDASAWAAQASMTMVSRAADATGSTSGEDIASWLMDGSTAPILGKDGAVFDHADGQLRQPLYGVRVNLSATKDTTPQAMTERAELLARLNPPTAAAGQCGLMAGAD
ncbi:ABC transporter substrate-binding protein [Paracoccus sp. SY]|uniref:ABC transporter substrate-binding protein n=1 Tax=Paracoccus sp. SY TaxID=1330255 RepID=UPI000CD17E51|nr:ABC transporter substrate-binding protein [Paracoccus sp. SY]